jgi:hypothetical protein
MPTLEQLKERADRAMREGHEFRARALDALEELQATVCRSIELHQVDRVRPDDELWRFISRPVGAKRHDAGGINNAMTPVRHAMPFLSQPVDFWVNPHF